MREADRQLARFVREIAEPVARKAWYRLPEQYRHVFGVEDIVQDIVVDWLEKRDRYDFAVREPRRFFAQVSQTCVRNFAWKVSTMEHAFRSGAPDRFMEVVLAFEADSPDGEKTFTVVEQKTPETLLFTSQEERELAEKTEILVKEIKALCETFEVEFKEAEVLQSLIGVLDKTLNKMSDAEFGKLARKEQMRLAELGEAVKKNGLHIHLQKGETVTRGLKAAIGEALDSGALSTEEVARFVKKKGIDFKMNSLRAMINGEKKMRGIKTGKVVVIRALIEELFKDGKGLTKPADVAAELEKRGVNFSLATVRTQVARLRREHGLTKPR